MMNKKDRIYVAGHRGLVGSALLRQLKNAGYLNLIYQTSSRLDLRRQGKVEEFFKTQKIDYVFLAAARVGGIEANRRYPAEFLYDNLMIQTNVIHSAYLSGVKRLLFLGSSCIYPRNCPQPIKEEYLLDGKLESTNEAYAVAKIAGIKLCQHCNSQFGTNFMAAMPSNLYGPGDNFSLETAHVLPALLRKFHEAKTGKTEEVIVWGSGKPRREFLYVDDLADALIFLMNNYDGNDLINIGTGQDLSIKELALEIKKAVGYQGRIVYDLSKPDGTPQKLLNVSRLNNLGWQPRVNLPEGIALTYQWYLEQMISQND